MNEKNTLEWLAELVSFDTVSRHSNLALIETVERHCRRFGMICRLSKSPDGSKANLLATLPASNGEIRGGLVLSGHTDVVPVDGQIWTSPPFELSEREDRLYGRGACDMKGFIAAVLAELPRWAESERSQALHFAFSYDEEVGCLGAPLLLDDMRRHGLNPQGCIVGEPTGMLPVAAHKGIQVFDCTVHGKAAHSSLTPQGCNAVEYAAQLICHIRSLAGRLQNGPLDHAFDVPFTTLTTNLVSGGIAVNTVPQECRLQYEFRNLPGIEPSAVQAEIEAYIENELLPAMRREYPEAAVDIRQTAAVPALEAAEDAAFSALVDALCQTPKRRKVAYATEAGLFRQAGIPTIVCGPGHIAQAHKADEYIERSQLAACGRFLGKLLKPADI